MNNENKQLKNIKLNEKEMAFLKLVCVSNNLTYPTTNDELISALESKIPIGVSMVVLKQYYEQEIVRMQILLRAYKVFDRQQKGKALLKADRQRRIERDMVSKRECIVCNAQQNLHYQCNGASVCGEHKVICNCQYDCPYITNTQSVKWMNESRINRGKEVFGICKCAKPNVLCFVCNEMVHPDDAISEYTLEHSYVTGEAGYYDHRCKSHKLVGHTYKNEKDGRKKSIIILCNMCEEVINGAAGEDYFNYDDSEDGLLVFCRSCDWEYNAPPSL